MPAPPLSNENNSNKVIFLSAKKKNANDVYISSYPPSMIYLDYHGDSQEIWLFLRTVSFSKKPKNEQKQKKNVHTTYFTY